MTIKGVIETVMSRIGMIVSGIRDFVTSEDFRRFISRLVSWIKSGALWLLNAISRFVVTLVRFLQSDGFRDGVRRSTEQAMRACKIVLSVTRWIARRLYEIATGEYVKTRLAIATGLFNRYLPKPGQQILATASIVIIAIFLILSEPGSEYDATVPEAINIESEIPKFAEIPAGRERKAAFFGYFLPIVENQNRLIQITRQRLEGWYRNRAEISSQHASEISEIAAGYRVADFDVENDKSWNKLLNRVDLVPPSLALVQAANESAWGTSRFAHQAQNFFGQWCFRKGCGLVPEKRDADKSHEVAAFGSPQESVKMYIRNLNSNSAYQLLRDIRARLRKLGKPITGHELAAGLHRYSERGSEYVKELREMIQFNKLTMYDTLEMISR